MTTPVPRDRVDILSAVLNRLIPSSRSLLIFALVIILLIVLLMIYRHPALLDKSAFMSFVGAFGTGFGMVLNHMFGGTKAGSEVMSAQSEALIKKADTPPAGGAS